MRVAVIGRREITDEEVSDLRYLGKMMARRGLELVTNGQDGTSDTVRVAYESMKLPGTSSTVMRKNVMEFVDKVIVYTDSTLDSLLQTRGIYHDAKIVRLDGHGDLKRFLDEVARVRPTDALLEQGGEDSQLLELDREPD